MPGLSIVYSANRLPENIRDKVNNALSLLIHNNNYDSKIRINDSSIILATSAYEDYPINIYENDEYFIYVEGKIYNKGSEILKSELNDLAKRLFADDTGIDKLKSWLYKADGEFIVFIRDKRKNSCLMFNDMLGHLPLYYYYGNGIFAISREIRFMQELRLDTKIDRMAIAQYLLFSFTVGHRTFLENVNRLKHGSLIYMKPVSSEVAINNTYTLNVERANENSSSIHENAANLKSLLIDACRNRANIHENRNNILSLSGGLDSRAIASIMRSLDERINCVTFLDTAKYYIDDVRIAEQIAKIYKLNWEQFELYPPKGSDASELLNIKCGLNTLKMRFILPFFRLVRERYDTNITYFTGDTGMVLRDYLPVRKVKNCDDAVRTLLSTGGRFSMYSLFSLKEASLLSGINEADIVNELKNAIDKYPEKDFNQKLKHFAFSEYCFNWHYEGMDRNRYYFWLAAPLESTQYFNYAINCPDIQKKDFTLYKELLNDLTPETRLVENASWNAAVDSKRFAFKSRLRNCYKKLPSSVKGMIRALVRKHPKYGPDSNLMNCLKDQINNHSAISKYMSVPAIYKMLKKCNKQEFDTLFTIISEIELYECGDSTIEKYRDCEFI